MRWEQLISRERFSNTTGKREVQEDYDTIICSTLFRRLQDKAQVFPLEEDDYIRTRLTHSLEVSAIGKRLGEYVFGKKEFSDILLCAGLVHDIGNPPFGHFGEYAIREWFQTHLSELKLGGKQVSQLLPKEAISDFCCFEGNAQSLRVLSKTPYLGRMEGFNLSFSVLASIIKYPVSSWDLKENNPKGYRKFGYNRAEKELFYAIDQATGMNGCRHPLSYLLEAADDIAYRASDLEDAMVKQIITLPQILDGLDRYCSQNLKEQDQKDGAFAAQVLSMIHRLKEIYEEEKEKQGIQSGRTAFMERKSSKTELTALQRWNRDMQEYMMRDAAEAFVRYSKEIMEGNFTEELFAGTPSGCLIHGIAGLSEKIIYTNSAKIKTELFGRRIIGGLLDEFMPAAIKYDTNEPMTFIECRIMDMVSSFYKSMYHAQSAGKGEEEKLYLRMLMITDYISGMTDNYAKRLYRELFS